MIRITKFIARHLLLTTLLAIVLLALLLSAARILTPGLLSGYAEHIAALASDRLDQPVSVGSVTARWHGFGPVLLLHEVTLGSSDPEVPSLTLDEIGVDFGLADMLVSGYLAPGRITVSGTRLIITRHTDGSLSLRGVRGNRGGDISHLLLIPARIRLHQAHVEWIDEFRGRPPVFLDDVELMIRNDRKRHQVDADFALSGHRVRLRADFQGTDIGDLAGWTGEIYLSSGDLPLADTLGAEVPAPFGLRSGHSDLELWADWASGRMQSLSGRIQINGLELTGTEGTVFDVDAMGGQFEWRRIGNGWQFEIADTVWRRAGIDRPFGRIGVSVTDTGTTAKAMRIHSDRLALEDLSGLVALGAPEKPWIDELLNANPSGEIHGLLLALRPNQGSYSISGEVRGMEMTAYGRLPTIRNVSGRFHATSNGGRLSLATRDAIVHPVSMFRWPIPLERLLGTLRWERHRDSWRLETDSLEAQNRHIRTHTRMRLELRPGGRPFLDLQTDFRDGIATYAPFYYPVNVMKPRLLAWLDRSIADGRIPWGSAIVRGPLDDFPFHKTHNGHFEVVFGIEDGHLNYRDDWPPLEAIVADVRFHNNSLEFTGGTAGIYDTRLKELSARFDSLRPLSPLDIRGKGRGPFDDNLRLLRETPLQKRYSPVLLETLGAGDSELDLAFVLPLARTGGEFSLEGTLTLDKASLNNPGLGLEFTEIDGIVELTHEGISARRLDSIFLDSRIHSSISQSAWSTRIHNYGVLDTRRIKRQFPVLSWLPLDGASAWNLAAYIPRHRLRPARPLVIEARSALEGTGVRLPLGLGKPPEGSRALDARISIADGKPRDVELTLDKLQLVAGRSDNGGWSARFQSPPVTGDLYLPPPGAANEPVRADLERIAVTLDATALAGSAAETQADSDTAAHDIPSIDLTADEVVLNDRPYGELAARVRRLDDGIRLEELVLGSGTGQLRLRGDWLVVPQGQRTSLDIDIDTTDLGQTLKDLTLSAATQGGSGTFNAQAAWDGSPWAPRRETLEGRISFHAEKGRFTDAEPGVGRLFGLLNVGALQRRLRLDFSDLFTEGFVFDRIKGEFTVSDGVAHTSDTLIDSPAGDIRISGTTDLVSTDMDQAITVTPAISGAVALAGGIAGGPVVGAALLAAGKGIDRLAIARYRMTGPWRDPKVERLADPAAEPDTTESTGLPEIH